MTTKTSKKQQQITAPVSKKLDLWVPPVKPSDREKHIALTLFVERYKLRITRAGEIHDATVMERDYAHALEAARIVSKLEGDSPIID